MWTIRIRWKILYEIFVCTWKGHQWDQFYPINAWASSDHFCRRCRVIRPSARRFREQTALGARHGYETLDHNGRVVGTRHITATNIPGDVLG